MHTFIINLDSSTERRATIAKQCETAGIPYQFIPAVNGKQLSQKEISQHTRSVNYAFKPGEIGCALSHLKIYQKIVNENIAQALILEDDALLTEQLPEVLSSPAMQLPVDKPVVVLLSQVNKFVNKVVAPITPTTGLYPVYSATTSHAYVINLEAARRLLKLLYPVWMAADKWCLFEEHGAFRLLAVYPAPVLLHDVAQHTTIQQFDDVDNHNRQKRAIWASIMAKRPLSAKIRQRYRRAVVPLLNPIVDVKAGLKESGQ